MPNEPGGPRCRELNGADTTATRAWLLADRERPGTFVELVDLESYESAMANGDHPGGQQWAEEPSSLPGTSVARNVDLVGAYDV